MTSLAWLAIPLVATVLALVWSAVASRPRGPQEAVDSVQAYQRFREAMSSGPVPPPVPPARRWHRRGAGRR